MKKIIGILGGMGPEATSKLFQEIISITPASKDQEHLPIIIYNNPSIPDRTEAILYDGESPVPELVATAKILEKAGADFILMPCNAAHYFIDDIQKEISIPIINMLEETAKFINKNYSNAQSIGLLATSGTVESGIYNDVFDKFGLSIIVPDKNTQEGFVMRAVYGEKGIKAGYKSFPRNLLKKAANELIGKGADIIVAGCTEIAIVITQKLFDFVVVDPSKILAEIAYKKAMG